MFAPHLQRAPLNGAQYCVIEADLIRQQWGKLCPFAKRGNETISGQESVIIDNLCGTADTVGDATLPESTWRLSRLVDEAVYVPILTYNFAWLP